MRGPLTILIAKLSSKGQMTVPVAARRRLKLGQGSRLDLTVHGDEMHFVVRPRKRRGAGKK